MQQELEDFMSFCRVERRLSQNSCRAYERDVGACLAFLDELGIRDLGRVGPAELRRFSTWIFGNPEVSDERALADGKDDRRERRRRRGLGTIALVLEAGGRLERAAGA